MVTVQVTSAYVDVAEPVVEEFFAEADTLDSAISLMLDNEQLVARRDWVARIEDTIACCFDPKGFSFTVIDDSMLYTPIAYRYIFTVY